MSGACTARRVVAHGRVQGVFFRAYTRSEALRLGLTGWVRNLPDGTVEAWLEGPPARVEAMVRWLHEGSPHSRVTALDCFEREAEGLYASFTIRR